MFELLWVRVSPILYVAALYHPPRPVYSTADLLSYVENCVAELTHDYPLADIILAGDLNQLHDDDIVERTGLTQIVRQPTRICLQCAAVQHHPRCVVIGQKRSQGRLAMASGAAASVGPSEPYVIVISLDFSKAFDSVHHLQLLHKFAQLDLPNTSTTGWPTSSITIPTALYSTINNHLCLTLPPA